MSYHVLTRALRHRNYRIFFAGYAVSLLGSWIQTVTTAWLAYRMTGSEFWLGVVTFAGQIPIFFISPLGGVAADRRDRRRVIMATQGLSMIQASMIAILFFAGALTLPLIIILETCLGIVKGFDVPVRQAFVLDMVEDREDLTNAIALNSSLFNGARLVGPVLAGILIARVGEGWCFVINAITFPAVLVSLEIMSTRPRAAGPGRHVLSELQDGVRYALGNPSVRILLAAVAFFSFIPVMVLYPVYARLVLGGDSHTYGLLVSSTGVGALTGALFLASRRRARGLGTIALCAALSFSAGAMLLSLVHTVYPAVVLCTTVGFGMMVLNASSNTILQTISLPEKRGRVVSLWIMAAMGAAPLGSLLGGAVAHRIGTPMTYLAGGVAGLAGTLFFLFHVRKVNRALEEAGGRGSPLTSAGE